MKYFSIRSDKQTSWIVSAIVLVLIYCFLASTSQAALPAPPKVGQVIFSADDPIGYIVGSIRYIVFLGLTVVVVFSLIGFSSGLISEVNEARKKGEWGRFAIYFGAGIFVVLVVIFGAWWGSERLSAIINL